MARASAAGFCTTQQNGKDMQKSETQQVQQGQNRCQSKLAPVELRRRRQSARNSVTAMRSVAFAAAAQVKRTVAADFGSHSQVEELRKMDQKLMTENNAHQERQSDDRRHEAVRDARRAARLGLDLA